jgi:hypothetical protein
MDDSPLSIFLLLRQTGRRWHDLAETGFLPGERHSHSCVRYTTIVEPMQSQIGPDLALGMNVP